MLGYISTTATTTTDCAENQNIAMRWRLFSLSDKDRVDSSNTTIQR
jgi:hypothetical protein